MPLDDKHWLTLVAQGPAAAMKEHQAEVERFVADTLVK